MPLKLFRYTRNRKYQNTSLISYLLWGGIYEKHHLFCFQYIWDWCLHGDVFFLGYRFMHQVALATVMYLLVWLSLKLEIIKGPIDPEISNHQAQPTDNVWLRFILSMQHFWYLSTNEWSWFWMIHDDSDFFSIISTRKHRLFSGFSFLKVLSCSWPPWNWCHPKVLSGTNCSLKCRSPPYDYEANDGVHPWWIAVGNGICVCVFLGTTSIRVWSLANMIE